MSPSEFDWQDVAAADHEARTTRHRPTDREVLLREALRLRAQGLRPRDIAEAFGMNKSEISALIEGTA